MSEWHEFSGRAALDAALADHLAGRLRQDIERRGQALLALSGGSTPKGMFRELARRDLPWSEVTLTLVDERWVEPDHPDLNERLVREHLLQGAAAEATLIGLKPPMTGIADGLAETAQRMGALPLPFTAVVLGMGVDGHTASWFPQADNLADLLDADRSSLVGITDPVTAPHQRITLTLPAVLRSGEIVLHFTGEDKRRVLESAGRDHKPIAAITGQTTTPLSIWWAP